MRFGRRERLNLAGEKSETWAARKLSVELLHSERQVRMYEVGKNDWCRAAIE